MTELEHLRPVAATTFVVQPGYPPPDSCGWVESWPRLSQWRLAAEWIKRALVRVARPNYKRTRIVSVARHRFTVASPIFPDDSLRWYWYR